MPNEIEKDNNGNGSLGFEAGTDGQIAEAEGTGNNSAQAEKEHFNTGELHFFAIGALIGTPADPTRLPEVDPRDLVPVTPEELEKVSAAFYNNVPGKIEPEGRDDDESPELTDPGIQISASPDPDSSEEISAEPETFERTETPRAVDAINEAVAEDGKTEKMRSLIIKHLNEVDDLFILMSRDNRSLFFSKMDISEVNEEEKGSMHLFKELALRLFNDPETDRAVYFPTINTEDEALKIFDKKTLNSLRLFDLLQLTIRQIIDANSVETYISRRIEYYLSCFCQRLKRLLEGDPDTNTEKAKELKSFLMRKDNTREDLDNTVKNVFIQRYSEYSYALFVEFYSMVQKCDEEKAKLYLESNILKTIQEKFKPDLDAFYDKINGVRQIVSQETSILFPQGQTGSSSAAEDFGREVIVSGDRRGTRQTLTGLGGIVSQKNAEKQPRDTVIAPNPLSLLGESVHVGESVHGEVGTEMADGEAGEPSVGAAPAVQEPSVVIQAEVGGRETPDPVQPEPEPEQAASLQEQQASAQVELIMENITPDSKEINKVSNPNIIIIGVGAAAIAVLLGLAGYIHSRKSGIEIKRPQTKTVLRPLADASVKSRAYDSSIPSEVRLADASIRTDAALKPDAAIPAPKADSAVLRDAETHKPDVEDKTLTMEITKYSLSKIAKTSQGRERLRKIALNESGEVVLNDKNPLYDHFGLHFIYQPEDIPLGKALFLNQKKLINKNGLWYQENGKRAFYYTGDKLIVQKLAE